MLFCLASAILGVALIFETVAATLLANNELDWARLVSGIVLLAPWVVLFCTCSLWTWLRWRRTHSRVKRLWDAGKPIEARRLAAEACAKRPNDFFMWVLASGTHVALNDFRAALICAQRAVDIHKSDCSMVNRAYVLFLLGALDDSLESAGESRTPAARLVRLCIFHTLRRPDRVRTELAQLSVSQDATLRYVIAGSLRQLGELELAKDAYSDAVTLARAKPSRPLLACALAKAGDYAEAEEHATLAMDSPRADGATIYALLCCQHHRHDLDSAWRSALALALRNPFLAIDALSDPELSPLMSDRRFRELFVACLRAHDEQVAWARKVINRDGSPPPNVFSANGPPAPARWPEPESASWGPA
jgi:tetratricopeptide (TPR) repeat protein